MSKSTAGAARRPGRPPKYPWDAWFARGSFWLTRGVDYTVSQSTMCGNVRWAAQERGLSVSVRDTGEAFWVEVRAKL